MSALLLFLFPFPVLDRIYGPSFIGTMSDRIAFFIVCFDRTICDDGCP